MDMNTTELPEFELVFDKGGVTKTVTLQIKEKQFK